MTPVDVGADNEPAGELHMAGGAVSCLYKIALSSACAAAPARDCPHALPRLRIVDAREQLAQLDGSREFAALLVGGADHGRLRFGDDEHRRRMRYIRIVGGKPLR